MLSAGRGVCLGRPQRGGTHTIPWTGTRGYRGRGLPSFVSIFTFVLLLILPLQGSAWPHDYRYGFSDHCPGPEWSVMCRNCCEYDVIRCKCPLQGTRVGYAVPCCRNAINECDPCIIHPGCSIFENCKRCNNGTWGPRDDFFIRGKFCAECRPGWSGGDCLQCGGVVRKRQGHLVLESYPNNARCEWTVQVDRAFTIDFRFMMLSLEFDHSCRYDYVEIRDGDSINSQVIGRFCGNTRPGLIQSSGNTLHVLFVSDGYKNFDGFFATFQESSACSSSPCLHDGTCVLDTSYSFYCACLSGYTGRRCENVEQSCSLPPKPAHGDHFLVYGPNDVLIALQYLCYRPYKLTGGSQRTCLPNNTWSGTPALCSRVNNTLEEPGRHMETNVAVKVTEGQANTTEATKTEAHTTEANAPAANTPEATTTEANTNEVNTTEVSTTEAYTTEVNATELNKAEVNTTELTTTEVNTREVNTTEAVNGHEVDAEHRNTTTGGHGEPSVINTLDIPDTEERRTFSPDPRGRGDALEGDWTDILNSVDTVETRDNDPAAVGEKDGRSKETTAGNDVIDDTRGGTAEVTEVAVVRDKGREEEEERRKEQVEEDSSPDKVSPNDSERKIALSERDNVLDAASEVAPEVVPTANRTWTADGNEIVTVNKTWVPPEPEMETVPSRSNSSRFTPYRAGDGEGEETPGKATTDGAKESRNEKTDEDTKAGKDAAGKAREDLEKEVKEQERQQKEKKKEEKEKKKEEEKEKKKEEEKEKDLNASIDGGVCRAPPRPHHGSLRPVPGLVPATVEYSCNHSYALSGEARRACQPNGTWSGTQPLCVRACREPKVSELVRQKVLPLQIPSRKTPIHKLYSMGLGHLLQADEPRGAVQALPQGFHHLYAQIEYQCASPYYHHAGSSRRTCLKTGKWSGRHVSCSPVCGKHSTFDPQRPAEAHWPWLAAIYRRSTKKANASKAASLKPLKSGAGSVPGGQDGGSDWQLVCSGALVNQRSVVVAAHCVTELGKAYPLGTAKMKVVVGKHYRNDLRTSKGLQHLRVASVAVHPNYDPLILDSDLAVLRLLDKARIGEQTLPLCLPDALVPPVAGVPREGLVTGWSPLPDPSLGVEERARVGLVRLADVVPCEQQYARNGAPVSVSDNMLCASHKPDYGVSNICPSDTGGILVLPGAPTSGDPAEGRDPEEGQAPWRLMGLVSFGYEQGECDPALYTVYTHVAHFKDWIEGLMR
ncbi:inactive serine protease PAMR1 [Gadus macrocephalus]|uniref:inactive serine protease PAMR1 n=1 Tax=Gadus macrocephalus TaxID=80720 RepID=UPI0028CB7A8E|nr:inactive serine protease PAMR1 [Gadus macrocephalus]